MVMESIVLSSKAALSAFTSSDGIVDTTFNTEQFAPILLAL